MSWREQIERRREALDMNSLSVENLQGLIADYVRDLEPMTTSFGLAKHLSLALSAQRKAASLVGGFEHWIFGVRGSLRLQTTEGLPTAYLWPRLAHSVKPDAFYDLVEKASPGPYLELFARRQRLGWDTWGNEALEHVSLETA